jgi:hypothetical protein
MNNMNKARRRTVWTMIGVSILTLIFGLTSEKANALKVNSLKVYTLKAPTISYSSNVLYINKYTNLVNIKNVINIDISKKKNNKIFYRIDDLSTNSTFIMPSYSIKLNLKQRVDKRVIISRLANAILSQETGGVGAYYRKSYSSSACGAFQYMSTSWNNFMGYKNACDAPEWVQDQRMINELKSSYNKYHDWRKAVAAHLYPARADNMNSWHLPIPGNPSVFQYVTSVFQKANIAY